LQPRGSDEKDKGTTMNLMSILIPEERIRVINKKVIDTLSKKFGVEINIERNEVKISGKTVDILKVKDIILAIGRGFSPEHAYALENDEYVIDIINLSGFSPNRQKVIRSRVIGTGGKIRSAIEDATECYVSVYGKTISIIGNWQDVKNAHKIIEMLINGAEHTTILKILKDFKMERIKWLKKQS
jgi:ribosomal RNA assembly protein